MIIGAIILLVGIVIGNLLKTLQSPRMYFSKIEDIKQLRSDMNFFNKNQAKIVDMSPDIDLGN